MTVTDISRGRAAEGVQSVVEQQVDGNWEVIARGASDPTGTISLDDRARPGIYRIELDTDVYFTTVGVVSLLPRVTITFRVPQACGYCFLEAYIAANSQFSALIRSDHPRS